MNEPANHNPGGGERQSAAADKIVLVGMMGSGKSTLGRLLAGRMGCLFVDVDAVIEKEAGRRIADIFRDEGEEGFRRRELEATRRLVGEPGRLVLATGGGAFCRECVREVLRERAVSVFLRVAEEGLLERLARSGVEERPMLGGEAWRERVAELLRVRYPVYEGADLVLEIGGGEEAGVTAERLYQLIRRLRRSRC